MTTDLLPTDLHWTPNPGHHEGQAKAHIFYAASTYRGMDVELRESGNVWHWSFYDPSSDDAETAVARDTAPDRDAAIRDLLDYIDGTVAPA
jgi:hypothetical protein